MVTITIKRVIFTLVALLIIVISTVLNAATPTLMWKHTYINKEMPIEFSWATTNHFVLDHTDSNRILNILITEEPGYLGKNDRSFWNMALLNKNTGEFVGKHITINSNDAHKDPWIKWFYGLGNRGETLTYYLKNDTLNFICGSFSYGYATIAAYFPLYIQSFKTHLSNDGLNLLYTPNGSIFQDTAIVENNVAAYFALYYGDELYFEKDFGFMSKAIDRTNNMLTICKIDTSRLDTFGQGTTWQHTSIKRDTIAQANLFENVFGLDDATNKTISSYHIPNTIDIDDTLSVYLMDVTLKGLSKDNNNTEGCLIVYYNRKTGDFYDKAFFKYSITIPKTDYMLDFNKNIICAVYASTYIRIVKKTLFSDSLNKTYNIYPFTSPLLKDRDLTIKPNTYHILDSIVYIYGTLIEADSNNSKLYFAKYKLNNSNNQVELLWENEWESEWLRYYNGYGLSWYRGNSILVRDNDIYLCGYRNSNSNQGTESQLVMEYFKIAENVGIEEINAIENGIKIYPNPTNNKTFTAEIIYGRDLSKLDIGLYDVLGKKILNLNNNYTYNDATHTISTTFRVPSEIPNGIYYLNVNNGIEYRTKAIVIGQ